MKKIILLTMMLPFLTFAHVMNKPVPVTHVYVPNGFDDNDNSEVIVSGYLPDSCYKAPSHQVKVSGNKILITINAIYSNVAGEVCAEVIVPFIETVRLGALTSQTYDIVVTSANPERMNSKLFVKRSSGSIIDDFDYAYITGVRNAPGNKTVTIDGYRVSDCFELDKVSLESNGIDTFVVLPIMKQVRDFCPMKMTPVSFNVTLPNTLNRKEVLIHVRSMQGNSVNSIFYSQLR